MFTFQEMYCTYCGSALHVIKGGGAKKSHVLHTCPACVQYISFNNSLPFFHYELSTVADFCNKKTCNL